MDHSNRINAALGHALAKLEPFGNSNPKPVFAIGPVMILNRRTLGKGDDHVKYTFADSEGRKLSAIAFGAADKFTLDSLSYDDEPQRVRVLIELSKNEWNGQTSVQGRIMGLGQI